jgi:hypothetical protein
VRDDSEIEGLVRSAWRRVVLFVVVALATLTGSLGARFAGRASDATMLTRGLLVVTAIAAGFAIVASGRPIQRRTRFDVDFMVGRVWLPGFLGLVLPPAVLVDAVLRLTSRSIGGYQTTREAGVAGNAYPEVALAHGEGGAARRDPAHDRNALARRGRVRRSGRLALQTLSTRPRKYTTLAATRDVACDPPRRHTRPGALRRRAPTRGRSTARPAARRACRRVDP